MRQPQPMPLKPSTRRLQVLINSRETFINISGSQGDFADVNSLLQSSLQSAVDPLGFVDLPSVAGLDPSIHDSPSTIHVLTTSTTGTLASLGSI